MIRMVELIERDYEKAREADLLSEWGEMPLLDSEDLVVMSGESLQRMAARLEEAERELDKGAAFRQTDAQRLARERRFSHRGRVVGAGDGGAVPPFAAPARRPRADPG